MFCMHRCEDIWVNLIPPTAPYGRKETRSWRDLEREGKPFFKRLKGEWGGGAKW